MPDDLSQILEETPEDILSGLTKEAASKITLIGGQALRIWGDQYLIDELTGEEYIHLASDDLDLLGNKHAIGLCAEAWGGKAFFPKMGDFTPQTGTVHLKSNSGKELVIDFLDNVHGLDNAEVHKYSESLIFGELNIPILSPPLCLKSRINNLVGLHYGDAKREREIVRINLAARATRKYIEAYLKAENGRPALKIASYLIRHVFLTKEAKKASLTYGAKFLHALPESNSLWPENARKIEFPKRLLQIHDKYASSSYE